MRAVLNAAGLAGGPALTRTGGGVGGRFGSGFFATTGLGGRGGGVGFGSAFGATGVGFGLDRGVVDVGDAAALAAANWSVNEAVSAGGGAAAGAPGAGSVAL